MDQPPSPAAVLERLFGLLPQWVLGCEEPRRQLGLADALLRAVQAEDLRPTAAGLISWGWQEYPLDGEHVKAAWRMHQELQPLPPAAVEMAAWLRKRLLFNLDARDFDELARSGEHGRLLKAALPLLRDERQGVFWLSRALDPMLAVGNREYALAAVDAALDRKACDPAGLALRRRLLAEIAFCLDEPETALEAVQDTDENVWGWWRAQRTAELLARLGRLEEAAARYARLLQAMPWHVNVLLRLDSLLREAGRPAPQNLDDAAVLLFTWNKADLLRDTLDRLAKTEAVRAGLVAVLDNGSTDHTPEVLDQAKQGPLGDKLLTLRPRVNVGAPAARNWLLSLEDVRAREYLIFLDDDVILEPGWLHALVAAARDHPECGTVGCRIKSAEPSGYLQSADYNLLPPESGRSPVQEVEQHVHVFDNCAGRQDTGLFTYTRPAAHVSGCCHLLRRKTLDSVGGFDIRFGPTQFDDLERDLRLLAAGSHCLYAGEVAARHVQFSSLAKAQTLAQTGQVMGNMIKLASMYELDAARRLYAANLETLCNHCLETARRVEEALK
jgi:GT2 family glycosyltransferase